MVESFRRKMHENKTVEQSLHPSMHRAHPDNGTLERGNPFLVSRSPTKCHQQRQFPHAFTYVHERADTAMRTCNRDTRAKSRARVSRRIAET